MKLVSWNVWNRSKDLEAFERFLHEQQADVYAFQELSTSHIDILRSIHGYELYIAEDFIEGEHLTHLGIFTRYDTLAHRVVTLNPDRLISPSWVGKYNRWIECLQSHYLTVSVQGSNVHIVNLHLSCGVSPTRRRFELMRAIEEVEQAERIVICGDMNTFGEPKRNWLIGLFCGFGIQDFFSNEIKSLDCFAQQRGMVRGPGKAITFPRLRLHLDHILSRGMDVISYETIGNTYGSDHAPVGVNLLA